ncbi:hypothetical protein V1507DRAFT_507172 [Lipomyces tetrasporus]
MAPRSILTTAVLASAILLGGIPATFAHGDEGHHEGMEMDKDPKPEGPHDPSYFALAEHKSVIYAHIAVMLIGWVFVLPIVNPLANEWTIAVMLSLAQSRYTLLIRVIFIATNTFGLLLGIRYNTKTPDLYPNNSHYKLGWVVTLVVLAQIALSVLGRFTPMFKTTTSPRLAKEQGLMSRANNNGYTHTDRTEYNDDPSDNCDDIQQPVPVDFIAKPVPRMWKALLLVHHFIDRTILILAFITICTGVVTYGRFFEKKKIFNGLAHWIKGGVFFWLGILTLGRWSGCFGELGWAWNVRPRTKQQRWRPSAEFVESGLIFLYGSTNIFLEHLGGWGGEWKEQDLEHLSITILFIGGGLTGMLIESTFIRELLNTEVVLDQDYEDDKDYDDSSPPEQYSFSINPFPALIILLLGIMMSSHTQGTMMSAMIHKQWGNLLAGASFARFMTYTIIYLKPPNSILPSRPPTELLASFGLIAGGIIFMASASDTVDGMINYELDVMFMYTVTMGLVGLLMAWVIALIALKGWAVRKGVDSRTFTD